MKAITHRHIAKRPDARRNPVSSRLTSAISRAADETGELSREIVKLL
jgi:hypothetical protein